jgi:rhodanese-related sulfurtransferase
MLDQPSSAPVLLDVREAWEFETARIEGSLHLPMSQIIARINDIPKDRPIACLCHHGARSMQVAVYLERQGHTQLFNVQGGIDAWSREVDTTVPTY